MNAMSLKKIKLFSIFCLIFCSDFVYAETNVKLKPTKKYQYTQVQTHKKIKFNYQKIARQILKNESFHLWQPNRTDNEILQEFEALDQWRNALWFEDPESEQPIPKAPFYPAKALIQSNYYRYPNTVAFHYNLSDPNYNASTVFLKNQTYIALEGPAPNASQRFYNFLYHQKITHVVRLTASNENGVEKCYPYWLNEVYKSKSSSTKAIQGQKSQDKNYPIKLNLAAQFSKTHNTPSKVYYFNSEAWLDGEGLPPEQFLKLILKVKKSIPEKNNSLIACHCSAGVGRTGTFIAGYHLIHEIDQQLQKGIPVEKLHISIEKIVKQLSIQRPLMVTKSEQYLSLYRLVDFYIHSLKTRA